jgi:CheY-like chemotaxis protein
MLADRAILVALVVEDEFLLRYDFVRKLKARGWLVLEAASGEAAVELLGTPTSTCYSPISGWAAD